MREETPEEMMREMTTLLAWIAVESAIEKYGYHYVMKLRPPSLKHTKELAFEILMENQHG